MSRQRLAVAALFLLATVPFAVPPFVEYLVAQDPQRTAAVDIVVDVDGPPHVTPRDGFVVTYAATAGARLTWDNRYPPGAVKGFKATGENGELMLIVISSTNGEYRFRLTGQLSVDKADGFDPLSTDEIVVLVGTGPGPDPGPGPGPGPGPAPTIPDDRFNNAARTAFTAVPPGAKARAPAVAAVYRSVVERLADGRIPSIGTASAVLQSERTTAFGTDAAAWSAFVAALTASFPTNLTKVDYMEYLGCVALGLEAVQ